jgi:double-stranded uracil-DNA glycosylase
LHSRGFRPVANADARVLVLGTLPGPMSLAMSQYYAQPRNAFWPIMGALFGALPELDYPARLRLLKRGRVALWDVCHSAFRPGALDASIDPRSIVPNDFATFFRSHRRIRVIYFNGQAAETLYRRLVLHDLPESVQRIPGVALPSTSPAHAAMRFEQKLERWRVVRRESEA